MDKSMSNRLAIIFVLIIAWIGLSQSAAFACSCAGLSSPSDDLRDADVVFAGLGWVTWRAHCKFGVQKS